ncbi:MAG: DMT family transporter [Coriobacteriia bacterium]|nr:DMT family transporter [Coriobacteriia bacterium]MBN2840799.1 DMT family transporter [Coriobacteriia bacterium]
MRRGLAVMLVIASAACFGTLAVLTALAYEYGARPLPTLAWRFAIAATLMGGYLALTRPAALRVGPGEFGRFALLSVTGYGAASLCFFFALQHASASVVTVLLYTYPALIAAAEALLTRTWPSRGAVAGIALTFLGCAMVVGAFEQDLRIDGIGVVLGLGAGAAYGLFTMLSDRLVPGRSRIVVMAYMFGISALVMALIAAAFGEPLSPVGWDPAVWWLLLAIVAVPTIAAVVLYLGGIRSLGPARAAMASTTEPVFTIILAWLALGERLTVLQAVGAVLVIGGIVLAERSAVITGRNGATMMSGLGAAEECEHAADQKAGDHDRRLPAERPRGRGLRVARPHAGAAQPPEGENP